MTQSGEVTTLKGESTDQIFNLKREASIYYSDSLSTFNDIKSAFIKSAGNSSLQMVFLLKGKLNGYLTGSKKACLTFAEQQHNILLINEKLQLQIKTETHEAIFIRIDPAFLSMYIPADHLGYLNLKDGMQKNEPALFSGCNLHMTSEIAAILNALRTSEHTGFCGKLFLESKILELLVLQLSQFELRKDDPAVRQLKEEELDKMHEVKEFLMNNMNQQFSLRSLAHMVGTNEFNLKRDFKLAFGTTVFGYLTDYKMTLAKRMLIEKDVTIAEVSEKTGYKYATHFSSAFKKYFGYLPNKIKSGKLSLLILIEDFSVVFENFVTMIP
ncbi:helix-turn-helix domain-containing protein [Pedobacter metabolipauper]|uniref:AraC-like DNA-binding protein n=1 Tax=Pedobacter metabolipauper TaxID=425513 RepID=A0A4V3D0Q4_9SPHI|nr:AraC family transcriptional regulator [Pedobacter metabolipauper]TDQ06616.1 AraC-like DNA-binding protein [Pedobacter metabolipauper]